ncbi:hypothetical protein [Natrinema ejinorense]|uniref:hypothetical protein n=1 Tax=Natrinema ejinorense TaxID=373386 RepID=UPI00117F0602|nr:hypothetical protein [Natrinema ejinorense]
MKSKADDNPHQRNREDIRFRSFISENSDLFTVMGVFAALSVYISRLPSETVDESYIQLGLVSSLLITGLVALGIMKSLSDIINPEEIFRLNNALITLFLISFLFLLYSLSRIVIKDPQEVSIIWSFFVITLLLMALYEGYDFIKNRLSPVIADQLLQKLISVFLVSSISHYLFPNIRAWLKRRYTLQQLEEANNVIESLPTLINNSIILLEEFTYPAMIIFGFSIFIHAMDILGTRCRKLKKLWEDH